MSVNSQIREKLISEDANHLSDDGVIFLSSNLRSQEETTLAIEWRIVKVKSGGSATYHQPERSS